MLKIYGDAEPTESTWRLSVAEVTSGSGFVGITETLYFILVVLNTSLTTKEPLYPASPTLLTWKAVSTSNPGSGLTKSTVIVLVAPRVVPSPDLILVIPTDPPVGPTMRYSSIFVWISIPEEG